MRLLTWNCRRGPLETKLRALEHLRADIVVLTEARRPHDDLPNSHWFGERSLGVLVLAGPELRLERPSSGAGCVHRLSVSGAHSFDLIATWTYPPPSYLGAFTRGMQQLRGTTRRGSTVLMGDLNGGPQFDKPRSRLRWSDAFAQLSIEDLHSAYHTIRSVTHGSEVEATHWHLSDAERPFHIDYCFAPSSWLRQATSLTVGSHTEWSALSDHAPVILDVDLRTTG